MSDWRARGACRDQPVRLFFPVDSTEAFDAYADAAAICAVCPVLLDCRSWAVRHEDQGFWGGMTERERRRERRRLGIRLREPATVLDDESWKPDRAAVLWRQGWRVDEIAAELHTTTRTVMRWLDAGGLDAYPPDGSRARRMRTTA